MKTISNIKKVLFFTVVFALAYTTAESQVSFGPYAQGISSETQKAGDAFAIVKFDDGTAGNTFEVPMDVAIEANQLPDDDLTLFTVFNPNCSDNPFLSGSYKIFWYYNGSLIGKGCIIEGPNCGAIRVVVVDTRTIAFAEGSLSLGPCHVTLPQKF